MYCIPYLLSGPWIKTQTTLKCIYSKHQQISYRMTLIFKWITPICIFLSINFHCKHSKFKYFLIIVNILTVRLSVPGRLPERLFQKSPQRCKLKNCFIQLKSISREGLVKQMMGEHCECDSFNLKCFLFISSLRYYI